MQIPWNWGHWDKLTGTSNKVPSCSVLNDADACRHLEGVMLESQLAFVCLVINGEQPRTVSPGPCHQFVEMTAELVNTTILRIQATIYVHLLMKSKRCITSGTWHGVSWNQGNLIEGLLSLRKIGSSKVRGFIYWWPCDMLSTSRLVSVFTFFTTSSTQFNCS